MDNLRRKHSHTLANDLMIAQNLPTNLNNEEDEEWSPAFFPKDFINTHIGITKENFAINDEQLLEYGKQVSKIRKDIREKAERIARQEGQELNQTQKQIEKAVKKISNRKATRIELDKN